MVRLSFWWIADTGLRLYHCQRCALCFKQDRALVDGQRTEVVTLHTTTSVFVQGALSALAQALPQPPRPPRASHAAVMTCGARLAALAGTGAGWITLRPGFSWGKAG